MSNPGRRVLLFCTPVGDYPVYRSPRFLSPRYRSPRPLITPYIYNPVPHITPSCLSPRPFITTSKFSLIFTPCNFSLPLVKEKLYHYITITVLLYHWYIINITIYYYQTTFLLENRTSWHSTCLLIVVMGSHHIHIILQRDGSKLFQDTDKLTPPFATLRCSARVWICVGVTRNG